MDSIALTSLRTAAVAALAAEHLALSDSRTITIVGCGEQGEAQLCAMAAVRPLRAGFAVDVDSARATSFVARLSLQLGWRLEASTNLAAAVAASDICVTCTTAESPLLFAEHLHPGLFVAVVGADNPAKQEIDATALSRSRVVVDSLAACAAGGDLHHAIKASAMTEQDVHGELSAIVAGRVPARSSRDQVFVFDSTGTALQDVAAAVLVYRRAAAAGAGLRVVLNDRDVGGATIPTQWKTSSRISSNWDRSVSAARRRLSVPCDATSSRIPLDHALTPFATSPRCRSQPYQAAAPTSYARHQAGHQGGTPAFSIT
jgi:ornithine cyclodeaminase/alanine dehydrogenase-like protein (mu-crystallin family)